MNGYENVETEPIVFTSFYGFVCISIVEKAGLSWEISGFFNSLLACYCCYYCRVLSALSVFSGFRFGLDFGLDGQEKIWTDLLYPLLFDESFL